MIISLDLLDTKLHTYHYTQHNKEIDYCMYIMRFASCNFLWTSTSTFYPPIPKFTLLPECPTKPELNEVWLVKITGFIRMDHRSMEWNSCREEPEVNLNYRRLDSSSNFLQYQSSAFSSLSSKFCKLYSYERKQQHGSDKLSRNILFLWFDFDCQMLVIL